MQVEVRKEQKSVSRLEGADTLPFSEGRRVFPSSLTEK
jgi:hypothetical protein